MLRSLTCGVSGLQQFQQRLDVIGNNISNSNTIGFKAARVDFEDTFSQTLQVGPNQSMQVGTGVTTGSISNQFSQGALNNTGVATDLAVAGNGFFVVRDTASTAQYATRDGSFHLDSSGYLVTDGGLRVQGFSDAGLSTRGDIQIDATGAPATAAAGAKVASFNIDTKGRVTVRLDDGTEFVRGQVLLQNFQNPQALVKNGDNLYSGFTFAGALSQNEAPGTNGLGSVQPGALEMANVDLTNEFAELITSQRGFQACARVITTSDEVLQEVVNLKR
jgi:flagellar hook protein FlgE